MSSLGILQMRIYALFSMNKKVLALMLIWFAASSSLSIWVLTKQLSSSSGQALGIPLLGGKFCVPTTIITNFYAFWIPILSFESLLCVLAVISGFKSYKRSPHAFRRGAMGLVSILVRDSITYFLVIGGTYLTCLLIWVLAPSSFIDTPIGFAMAMSCVLGNRVLLNVRQAALESSVHMSWHRQEE
ncbi:hypothetical protein GALMADRAFT_229072 [Galerina marginata CBS 339.88]|uniref:Uncharacterized protein n=1 Tax=Galerina marginata (strain CBS 339.88) TaxID=685588 RepID=A0A067SZP7_GALM3|nr:hypothetical protein GALMADRAFT_229072 [Galerina marginata CBS 339.88]